LLFGFIKDTMLSTEICRRRQKVSVVEENRPVRVAKNFRQALEECGGSFWAQGAVDLLRAIDPGSRVLANTFFWKAIDRKLLPTAVRYLKEKVKEAESRDQTYRVTATDLLYIQNFIRQGV
jgi:hypothetical protein